MISRKRFLFLIFTIVTFFVFVSVCFADTVTEEDLAQFFGQIENICNERNVDAYIGCMKKDVEVLINFEGEALSFSTDQYKQYLDDTWKMYSGFKYEFQIKKVEISGAIAIVEGEIVETITYTAGKTVTEKTKETVVLEKSGGKIKFKSKKAQM